MRFIVDENLPPELAIDLRENGITAHHVNEMKSNQKQRITDDQLRRLTIRKGYVIITKDDDFVKSYVSRKIPEQMVFIYGLEKKESLLKRMKEVIPQLLDLLTIHDFIEIKEDEMKFPFSG
ncbi:DUF5615 family PIN-like protein [Ekhidna sp.]|uniref:DUF5615 family PIN-like protein n=1 Tax=Ekhidna sp. TaxID=2608089 RepID=UPI003297E31C